VVESSLNPIPRAGSSELPLYTHCEPKSKG
jgi:hypothetical protein